MTNTYNQANQLTDLTQGTTIFQFNYNGDGVRLRQVIAGVPTSYTQDLRRRCLLCYSPRWAQMPQSMCMLSACDR